MQIRIAAVLGVLLVSGCRVVEPAPAPTAPRIANFTASKTRTAPGEEVTLTFSATDATKLELTDDSGNAVQLEGATESGTAKVAPTRSAFYVLRATGAGGRDTAFLQIAVNEPLKDLFLIAVPGTINAGEQAQLIWGAPGASTVTLQTGSATPVPLTGSTGTVTLNPLATEQYTLSARGAPGTPPLTALAGIQVRPVLAIGTLTAPDGYGAGKTLTFAWSTAGATSVAVSEQNFGLLTAVTDPSSVTNGTFDYVLPATLPNGITVTDGLPLRFTIAATAGGFTVNRTLTAVVGDLPVIERLDAPEFASVSKPFTVSWKTLNASQVAITVNGLPIFQTLPGAQAGVDEGSLSLPAPTVPTEYTLVATNERGGASAQVFNVRPVPLPIINTFTLTPTINALGDPATARWTTTNAVRLQLRFENGVTLAVVTTPSQVNNGNVVLTPASSGRVTLEAYNAAGALDSRTLPINFTGASVSVTPIPVLRGAQATLNWTLAPAGVVETVGLPTPAPAPMPNSVNFVDLNNVATAEELVMRDPATGFEQLPAPAGFRFPLLGKVQPIYVAVDGFIAFAPPTVSGANVDFTTPANGAPAMLAPFWDDLTLPMTAKVLYALQSAANGERYLVVQWDKAQIAGAGSSELTFQVHLYETGQVAFIYKTLTGALNSSTVGVNVPSFSLVQQFTFNSIAIVPSADLELNYFTGGPADGTRTFTASRSERIEFFGRTATGLVPASVEVRAFGPGDVSVTEVMPLPEASVAATGQWVELRNNASVPVDFDGLTVSSLGSTVDGGYVILPGTVVPAGGYLVLGQSTSTVDTGGAQVTAVATDLPLTVPDSVKVSLEGTTLGSLSWDAGTVGSSVQPIERVLLSTGTFTCARTSTFGPAGAVGTPGAVNDPCAPYVIEPIGAGYVDISTTGTVILASASSFTGTGSFPLTTPFTYFGQTYSSVNVAMVGFVTFGGSLASGDYDPNDTTPATSAPNGVVAPFWDELVRNSTGKLLMQQDPTRTIISWQDFRIFGTTSSAYFQVHLLPNGVIEFHYGNMSSSTQTTVNALRGLSATAWIEKPDGTLAVPLSVNTLGGIQPNSSFRFTPVP